LFGSLPTLFDADTVNEPRLRREFLRYFIVSAVALTLDLAIFSLLFRTGLLGWFFSGIAGFAAGLAASYFLCIRFVFSYRQLGRTPAAEFIVFALIGLVGVVVTELVLWLGIEVLVINAEISKLAAAGVTFVCNFTLRRGLLFRRRVLAARNPVA